MVDQSSADRARPEGVQSAAYQMGTRSASSPYDGGLPPDGGLEAEIAPDAASSAQSGGR